MAAALAAATLSAAAVGSTAVEDVAALVELADVVLFSPGPLLVLVAVAEASLLEDVVCLNDEDEVRVLVILEAAGVGFLASSPALAAVVGLLGLEAAPPGLVTLDAGFGLLLEAELALEVCLDTPGVAEAVLLVGRVEEVGRRGGILSLVSVLGLERSVLGTAGFLVAESGLEGIGFLSKGLVTPVFGVCLETPVDVAEDVLEPDLLDLASSTAFTAGFVLPATEADVGRDAVVLVAVVAADAGFVAATVLAGVGLVVFSSFLSGADFARTELGALALVLAAGTVLDPGVGFLAGDPGVAFFVGDGVSDFFWEDDAAGFWSDSCLEGLSISATSSDFESLRGVGSGDRSLIGVAGVTASSGILRLATP